MTIKEHITDTMLAAAEDRLQKLKAIPAPAVMIEGQQRMVEDLKQGRLKISGDVSVLDEEVKSCVVKTGRGGKRYAIFNDRINFFPAAKYGPYIKIAG